MNPKDYLLYKTGFMLDCFVPANEEFTKLVIGRNEAIQKTCQQYIFLFQVFLFTTENRNFAM